MKKGNVHISYAFELQKAYEKGKADERARCLKETLKIIRQISYKGYDENNKSFNELNADKLISKIKELLGEKQ